MVASRPTEPHHLVFDSGPLITMACSSGEFLRAVGDLVGDRARWADAVKSEVTYKAGQLRFACASQVLRAPWLGDPVELSSDADLREIEEVRLRLARAADGPLTHLGEAASIVLARRLERSGLVMDDRDARALAASAGIPCATTLHLLEALVAGDRFDCGEAFQVFTRMARISRVPHRERQDFCPPCRAHR